MFEVYMYIGSYRKITKTCDVGDLLPTIASIMQECEADEGEYIYQQNYAIAWRKVKE